MNEQCIIIGNLKVNPEWNVWHVASDPDNEETISLWQAFDIVIGEGAVEDIYSALSMIEYVLGENEELFATSREKYAETRQAGPLGFLPKK